MALVAERAIMDMAAHLVNRAGILGLTEHLFRHAQLAVAEAVVDSTAAVAVGTLVVDIGKQNDRLK